MLSLIYNKTMGLFNFNRHSQSEASHSDPESPVSAEPTPTVFTTEHQTAATQEVDRANAERLQRERQERKLIGMFLEGAAIVAQPDYNVNDQLRSAVYTSLANGDIKPERKSALLQHIATPDLTRQGSPEHTLAALSSKHERRILAYMNQIPTNQWESLTAATVTNFLSRYPTPIEFETSEQYFLKDVADHNSPQKLAEYQQDIEKFKRTIYGKRYEYYLAMKSLEAKAAQSLNAQTKREEVMQAFQSQAETSPSIPEQVSVYRLSEDASNEILRQANIDGDPVVFNGQAYRLTPDQLKTYGLAPTYTFNLENTQISLSPSYTTGSHAAITAYVKTEHGTQICSYYRSNSQGVWRYLPDYAAGKDGSGIGWYGKGYSEESLTLPIETQYALELVSQQPHVDLDPVSATYCLAGTAKRYENIDAYRAALYHHQMRGVHYQEVSAAPAAQFGHLTKNYKVDPKQLDIPGTEAPNFQQDFLSYTSNTALYGNITVDHFPSKDGRYYYTFNRNQNNEGWLGGIEARSPLSSAGLRTKWVESGDYSTPLYDYESQTGGYGDLFQPKIGRYVSMWKHYLSQAPLIQKYLQSVHT